MIEEKKIDRRTLKTKKAIHGAFTCLLSYKDLNEITIKDIADKADINRKTFYYYYKGIYEIEQEIQDEIIASMDEVFNEIEFKDDSSVFLNLFNKLSNAINKHVDFYYKVIKVNGETDFINKLFKAMEKRMIKSLKNRYNMTDVIASFVSNFYISGLVSLYSHWVKYKDGMTIEELTSNLCTLIFEGINGLIDKNTNTTNNTANANVINTTI